MARCTATVLLSSAELPTWRLYSSNPPSKTTHQRAGTELLGDGGHVLQTLRLAESAHKPSALDTARAQQIPLGQDDCPRDHAEGKQKEEDGLGDDSRFLNQVNDFAADKHARQVIKMHFVSREAFRSIIDQGLQDALLLKAVN